MAATLILASARPARTQTVEVADFTVSGPAFGDHVQEVDVAVGTDGRITYIWGEYDTGSGINSGKAVTRQSDAAGTLVGPATRADTTGHVFGPTLDSDTRGGYVAAWRWIQSGQEYAHFAQFLDTGGAPVGEDVQVDFQNGGATQPAGLAGLPSGSVFMWDQLNKLWGQLFDVQRQPVGEPFVIGVPGPIGRYATGGTPNGGFVSTWKNTWSSPFSFARAYDADGQPLGDEFTIGPADFRIEGVAASAQGWLVASGSRANDALNNDEVWIVRFTPDGQVLGSHRVEIPAENVRIESDVAVDAQGKIYVVWSEYQLPGEGARPPRARAFDPDGNAVTFGFWPTLDDALDVRTAVLPNGQFVNFWYRYNKVLANIVSIPPPSGVVCGDGVVTPGFEECDDGAANSDTAPGACRTNCLLPACGDTVIDDGEQCDDGNTASCDGCSGSCVAEPGVVCGDGIPEPACGEQCDDGNTLSGDGCTFGCTLEPCIACSGTPSVCTATPPADTCKTPVQSQGSQVQLKRHPFTERKDKLSWKYTKGAATTVADLGNPTTATDYELCVYDGPGAGASLLLGASIPAGGTCSGKPCWKMIGAAPGKGFKYKDKEQRPDGIGSVVVKAGPEGRAKILVKGKGIWLDMPALPVATNATVTVQLSNDAGTCWSDTYGAPAMKNDGVQFKDKGD
jgi:cysteine-rich repeat protein